ncbi:MAG: SDR family NAD(P)-dependent oxidoreductase [Gammaproteobacteria bacterium]|nr:SDR family NAD(P)-dependent oxidoreductase [Gammaproteobacteria bacterium]
MQLNRRTQSFRDRYGTWAVLAGAGEGLGAAFAMDLARRGMNVLLIARREHQIATVAAEIQSTYEVQARCLACDLGLAKTISEIETEVADKEVGVLVYNAAHIPIGCFLDIDASDIEQALAVNVRGPIALIHSLVPGMQTRQRGGIVLMSSLAGLQGAHGLVTYSSSKAFNIILGEGLWRELREHGIDVVTCIAGAVRTPGYARYSSRDTPGILDPETVARQALDALPNGPRFIPGLTNRFSAQLLTRLLPRKAAIALLANASHRRD